MFSLLKKKRIEADGSENPSSLSSTMASSLPPFPAHGLVGQDTAHRPAETTSLATNSIASVLNPYPYPMPHASGGSLTSSPSSTCPHCRQTFYETTMQNFNDHVTSCPDFDQDDESETSSVLSDVMRSPIASAIPQLDVDDDDDDEEEEEEDTSFVPMDPFSLQEPEPVHEVAVQKNGASSKNVLGKFQYGTANYGVRPYQNPQKVFDYYNETDGHEQVDVDLENPENSAKLRFPTLTKLEDFGEYLANPEDMNEATLYQRTSEAVKILQAYQDEFDDIDKQVVAYENTVKSDLEAVQVLAKEREATNREAEMSRVKNELRNKNPVERAQEEARIFGLAAIVKKKKSASEWFDAIHKADTKLKPWADPNKLEEEFHREQVEEQTQRNGKTPLEYAPYPDYKPTKDEELDEKRRAGRLAPLWKFNDMKTADVYGFEYNPHVKYQGNQPLVPVVNKRRGANGIEVNDTGRLRTQRMPNKKFYQNSHSPESDTDGNPARRTRKPRNFGDMESAAISRPGSSNRDRSPKRFFPSGKKIGRPSRAEVLAKSNLSNSMIADSQTPEMSQEGSSQEARGAQELADDIQHDLTSAAARIVGNAPTKPKGKGGRPKKNAPKVTKPKGKGKVKSSKNQGHIGDADTEQASTGLMDSGRTGIQNEPTSQTDLNGFMQSTEEDDRTRQSSEAYTSRPTTSSSNMTYSTEGSGRTRTKSKGNHGGMSVDSASKRKRDGHDPVDATNTGRGKRTKTAHRPFDPSSSIDSEGVHGIKRQRQDDEQALHLSEIPKHAPANKKRKVTSGIEEEDSEDDDEDDGAEGEGMGKLSREESLIAITGNPSLTPSTDPPARKRRGTAKVKDEVPIEEWVADARSEDGRHLSLILDPAERELVRKRRVKRGKSDKLSKSMRARWNDGRMNVAMETRKANAVKKKEEEKVPNMADEQPEIQPQPEPAVRATSAPKTVAPKPAPVAKLASAPKPVTSIKIKKSKVPAKEDTEEDAIYDESEEDEDTPAPPPVSGRRMSTRERKKPARVMGLDGTNEEETELQRQFKSEYDRYQALTSPGTPIRLGKRVRKQINFAEPAGGSDEDEYS